MKEMNANDHALRLLGSTGPHAGDVHLGREATRPTEGSWVWWIPGTQLEEDMPICVLMTGNDGPRCLRTNVRAPTHIRPWNIPYKEIAPRPVDLAVFDAIRRSLILERCGTTVQDPDATVQTSRSVSAASRFLGAEAVACVPAVRPIRQNQLLVGQSVSVTLRGWEVQLSGWIVSTEEPLQIVVADAKGRYRKIEAYADCLVGEE